MADKISEFPDCIKCGTPKQPGSTECHECGAIYAKAEAIWTQKKEDDPEPGPYSSKISFQYSDSEGNRTKRTVNSACTFKYDGREYIYGRCELRKEHRTFRADRIIGYIIDARTGEIITTGKLLQVDPPEDWIQKDEPGNKFTSNTNNKLTRCPVCSRDISKNAESCPGCGEPINPSPPPKQTVIKQNKSGTGCGTFILIIFVIGFLSSIFDTDDKKTSPGKPKPAATQENPNCRWELQCWGDKHNISASVRCASHVEKLAKYSHKWTDGFLDIKFGRFRWLDRKAGTMTYLGDKIQFQNGFGAWQNYSYECDFNPATETVIDVRAYPTAGF